jgi:hypothetical protein
MAEEGRHPPGPEQWWGESWYFDFVQPDWDVAGYCRLGLYPNQDAAWFWFHVVRPGGPTVQIRDHSVACPGRDDLDVAGAGWRASLAPTADGFTVLVDGDGRILADPMDAYGEELGPDIGMTAELAWHGRGPVFEYGVTTRYEQTCRVEGRLAVGDREWGIEAVGQRDHSWGVRDWLHPHLWSSGTLDDGWAYHLVRLPGLDVTIGYLLSPDDVIEPLVTADVAAGLDGLLAGTTTLDLRSARHRARITATPEAHAPVDLPTPDGTGSRFPRAAVALVTDDGRSGWGWIEYNLPGGDASAFALS